MPKRSRDIGGAGGFTIPAQGEEFPARLARPLARVAISRYARERGMTTVTPELMDEYRARMGF